MMTKLAFARKIANTNALLQIFLVQALFYAAVYLSGVHAPDYATFAASLLIGFLTGSLNHHCEEITKQHDDEGLKAF